MKNLLRSELYKLRVSSIFRRFLIATFLTAVVTIIFINMMEGFTEAPQEFLDQMLVGGVYNFGFIQINNISDLANMTSLLAISAAFTNFGFLILMALFVSKYMKAEFENGGIRNFLLKGFNRNKILLSKYIAMLIAVTIMVCVYFFVYCVASFIIFGVIGLDSAFAFSMVAFFVTQLFLIISFSTICFSTLFLSRNISIIILNAGMVIAGAMAINMIRILSNGQLELSYFWVVDYITALRPGENCNLLLLPVGIITIALSLFVANWKFKRTEFD